LERNDRKEAPAGEDEESRTPAAVARKACANSRRVEYVDEFDVEDEVGRIESDVESGSGGIFVKVMVRDEMLPFCA
jgi:hypothetical protein